jgi:cell wall-associated NlpC family hydrolase
MKILSTFLAALFLTLIAATRILAFQADVPKTEVSGNENSMKTVIDRHLGKPYVWGAAGNKSFDCSGFVWRVLNDNGIYLKRTTARKLFMALPQTSTNNTWNFGNIVFFDDLRHCGIVCNRDTFYHAESSIGTNLSRFKPYWQKKIVGIRQIPVKNERP